MREPVLEERHMDNVANTNAPGSPGPGKPATPHDTTTKEAPAGGGTAVSHTPLNLGGAPTAAPAAPPHPTAAPAAPHPAAPAPATHPPAATGPGVPSPAVIKKPTPVSPPVVAASARTTGIKTFFTKLHPGAINFLDEQITKWLKENPTVVIKHTNVTTGDIVDKKTEPNLLITIWY
jgi:hypothetical protein